MIVFFFFKQKTAYEIRISDWSSDVCSSDLVADAHGGHALPVDALDLLEEAVHEVLPELLAVADDVDAGGLLEADPVERRLLLALDQLGPLQPPGRPEFFGFRQPGRLRQAACHSRRNHGILPRSEANTSELQSLIPISY